MKVTIETSSETRGYKVVAEIDGVTYEQTHELRSYGARQTNKVDWDELPQEDDALSYAMGDIASAAYDLARWEYERDGEFGEDDGEDDE